MSEFAALSPLAQYGVIGVVVLAIITGLLLPKPWVDRLLKNKDDQIENLNKQNDILMKFQEPVIKLVETLNHQIENREKEEP